VLSDHVLERIVRASQDIIKRKKELDTTKIDQSADPPGIPRVSECNLNLKEKRLTWWLGEHERDIEQRLSNHWQTVNQPVNWTPALVNQGGGGKAVDRGITWAQARSKERCELMVVFMSTQRSSKSTLDTASTETHEP
jgi:hypothetical protein